MVARLRTKRCSWYQEVTEEIKSRLDKSGRLFSQLNKETNPYSLQCLPFTYVSIDIFKLPSSLVLCALVKASWQIYTSGLSMNSAIFRIQTHFNHKKMISRQWKCILKEEANDEYINFLHQVVFAEAKALPGFVQANIYKRKTHSGLEFLVSTLWKDQESIKAFAGNDISVAMVPEKAQQMMASFDKSVVHYETV